jgi:hypothetical protein
VAADDADLIREALRSVLRADASNGKALEAKAAAARQLAKLAGLADDDAKADEQELAPDPMRDLDDEFTAYRERRARRRPAARRRSA